MRERFTKIVKNTAEQFGAQVTIEWGKTPTVTYNDETLTPLIFEHSKQFAEVLEVAPLTGGRRLCDLPRTYSRRFCLDWQQR